MFLVILVHKIHRKPYQKNNLLKYITLSLFHYTILNFNFLPSYWNTSKTDFFEIIRGRLLLLLLLLTSRMLCSFFFFISNFPDLLKLNFESLFWAQISKNPETWKLGGKNATHLASNFDQIISINLVLEVFRCPCTQYKCLVQTDQQIYPATTPSTPKQMSSYKQINRSTLVQLPLPRNKCPRTNRLSEVGFSTN